jgi:hypothetical protein
MQLPFNLMGQHVIINAYKTKDPNHYIDGAGNVRDQNGRLLANENYGNVNNYVEIDGKAIYEAHKIREKLERKGHSGQMIIRTTLPNDRNNGGLNQPITIPFGNSVRQEASPIQVIQPIQLVQTPSVKLPEVTPWELGEVAVAFYRRGLL